MTVAPELAQDGAAAARRRELVGKLAFAFAFRGVGVAGMIWLALWAEARPAPSLPDAVLSVVPYVPWVNNVNYLLWLLGYIPVAAALLFRDVDRFCRYMVTAGWLALVRGVCIAATGLGPTRGPDTNAGMNAATRLQAFTQLTVPLNGLFHHARPLTLTKDLFFSGHTSTTFLLLLYVARFPKLRGWMLVAHVLVVASVFFAHMHYTIDVLGAYAMTFAVFAIREADVRALVLGGRE